MKYRGNERQRNEKEHRKIDKKKETEREKKVKRFISQDRWRQNRFFVFDCLLCFIYLLSLFRGSYDATGDAFAFTLKASSPLKILTCLLVFLFFLCRSFRDSLCGFCLFPNCAFCLLFCLLLLFPLKSLSIIWDRLLVSLIESKRLLFKFVAAIDAFLAAARGPLRAPPVVALRAPPLRGPRTVHKALIKAAPM